MELIILWAMYVAPPVALGFKYGRLGRTHMQVILAFALLFALAALEFRPSLLGYSLSVASHTLYLTILYGAGVIAKRLVLRRQAEG